MYEFGRSMTFINMLPDLLLKVMNRMKAENLESRTWGGEFYGKGTRRDDS
jgi:hypothetical protein